MVSPSRRDHHQFKDSDTSVLSTNIPMHQDGNYHGTRLRIFDKRTRFEIQDLITVLTFQDRLKDQVGTILLITRKIRSPKKMLQFENQKRRYGSNNDIKLALVAFLFIVF